MALMVPLFVFLVVIGQSTVGQCDDPNAVDAAAIARLQAPPLGLPVVPRSNDNPITEKKIELGRFKGLGEMMPKQLKETTMDPEKRTLLRVGIKDLEPTKKSIDALMGNKPEKRFAFIQENAEFVEGELPDVNNPFYTMDWGSLSGQAAAAE